jgi:hypothetical protein
MAEERARLERQVDSLSGTLAKKEARLRGSVDALAKASYKLRASFTAEVGEGMDRGGGDEEDQSVLECIADVHHAQCERAKASYKL